MSLDRVDRQILRILQGDGRISNADLAAQINLSPSACLRRVKSLEEAGVIDRYVALLNQQKIGKPMSIIVEISLHSQSLDVLNAFEAAVCRSSEIRECFLMAGDADYIIKVSASDAADFERIHRDHLATLPGVSKMRSNFAIRKVVDRTDFELSEHHQPLP